MCILNILKHYDIKLKKFSPRLPKEKRGSYRMWGWREVKILSEGDGDLEKKEAVDGISARGVYVCVGGGGGI